MRTAADIADWWDKQHATSKKALDDFVDENPGLFGVVVATAVATAMEVGKGSVDVLRFGEGLAEGSAGGIGQDALRALSIVGTVGKGAKVIKEVVSRSRMMKLIVDPGGRAAALGGGGRCVYVSATQALRETGQKAFASVDDLARELGLTIDDLGTSSGLHLRTFLMKLKARIGPVLNVKTWKDIERAVPHDGSVVSFGVSFKGGGGHRLYAFRDMLGRVKIMDRGGRGALPRVLDTLDDVVKRYGKGGIAAFNESFEIKDLFLKFVGPKGLATLAMEVLGTTSADAQKVAQAFEVYKQEQGAEPGKPRRIKGPELAIGGGFTGEGIAGHRDKSTLSGIAKAQYGDFNLWPLIFDLNKDKIGPNPNRIKPGTKLLLLPVENYTDAEIADARKRAPAWRNYPL